jgi:outer membrane protein assembly factor BamB
MITAGAKAMYAYDPATGKELWKYGHKGYSASMRPVVGFGMAYLTTGYGGADLVAMKLGGSGPISEGQIAWRYRKQVPSKPSPLIVDDLLYLIQDSGVLTCLDAKTGEEYYKERVGGQYSASPTYAGGRIYLFTDTGKSLVIKPGKKLEILAENTLADGCMACVPAVGKALFVRTKSAMYRIEE